MDLSPGVTPTVTVVVVAGDRCALGVVQIRTVRPKFLPPPKHDCD